MPISMFFGSNYYNVYATSLFFYKLFYVLQICFQPVVTPGLLLGDTVLEHIIL